MPAVEPPGLWTLGFLGVLGLTIAWVLVRSLAAGAQRPGSPSSFAQSAPPPELTAPAIRSAALSEDALHATARELAARLDSKICRLESLLRDADRAASRLEAAVAATAARCPDVPSATEAIAPPASPPTRPMLPNEPPASTQALPPRLPGQAEGLKDATLLAALRLHNESPPPSAHVRCPGLPRYEPIHVLADQGHPAEEIARRTGIPLGEVQLVLNLRRVEMPAGTL